jgi:hypothetical protein
VVLGRRAKKLQQYSLSLLHPPVPLVCSPREPQPSRTRDCLQAACTYWCHKNYDRSLCATLILYIFHAIDVVTYILFQLITQCWHYTVCYYFIVYPPTCFDYQQPSSGRLLTQNNYFDVGTWYAFATCMCVIKRKRNIQVGFANRSSLEWYESHTATQHAVWTHRLRTVFFGI